jgi:hypothetical protein
MKVFRENFANNSNRNTKISQSQMHTGSAVSPSGDLHTYHDTGAEGPTGQNHTARKTQEEFQFQIRVK